MKTALDIRQDFGITKTVTSGKEDLYTCVATLADGEKVTGYGTTLENAEDTAWHGVMITLKDMGAETRNWFGVPVTFTRGKAINRTLDVVEAVSENGRHLFSDAAWRALPILP